MACTNCTRLANNAANMILNGVNTQVCNSLQSNTGFDPSVNTNNCTDLHDLSGCIKSTLASEIETIDACDWRNMIRYMIRNQYIMNESLVCDTCGQWLEIQKIWDAIDAILTGGANATILVEGTDFTWNWLNNWYSYGGFLPTVRLYETGDHVKELNIATNGGNAANSQLAHDNLNNTLIAHANVNDVGYQLATSIFGFTFLGQYAYLNSANVVSNGTGTSRTMNNRPLDARANWDMSYGYVRNAAWGLGNVYVFGMYTFADGWNDQFTRYNEPSLRSAYSNFSYNIVFYV